MIKKLLSIHLLLALLLSTACQDEEGTKGVDFDEKAMLTNYGQNIIFPAYASFQQKTATLQSSITAFTQTPTEASLTAAQEALKEAWLSWQDVSLYEFGPAETLGLRMNINQFPTSTSKINNAVSGNNQDVSGVFAADMRGFPALDYMLFTLDGDNATVLERYTSHQHAANWKTLLNNVATHLNAQAQAVYNGWKPDGQNYLGTFNSSTGNSATSSLSYLVNQINQGFEIIKNVKLGIPIGLKSLNGQPIPQAVEAYYSGYSLALMKRNAEAVVRTFSGTNAAGTDGLGLEDYLNAHFQAGNTGGEDVSASIKAQLQKIDAALNNLPSPLSSAVVNQPALANTAYQEMQNLVPLMKGRMSSILSVDINYFDNDGD